MEGKERGRKKRVEGKEEKECKGERGGGGGEEEGGEEG